MGLAGGKQVQATCIKVYEDIGVYREMCRCTYQWSDSAETIPTTCSQSVMGQHLGTCNIAWRIDKNDTCAGIGPVYVHPHIDMSIQVNYPTCSLDET